MTGSNSSLENRQKGRSEAAASVFFSTIAPSLPWVTLPDNFLERRLKFMEVERSLTLNIAIKTKKKKNYKLINKTSTVGEKAWKGQK